jgi:pyruvate/2-oxoglutarate dehydrogenase complex dihydrolipoamide dehydrogenase (E3) component
MRPVLPGAELAWVSDDMFLLEELPQRVVIVGAGFIACEFACILNGLGVAVTQLVRGDHLLRGFDLELSGAVREGMEAEGIDIRFSHSPAAISGTATDPLAPAAPWQVYRQHQQQPNQVPAGSVLPAADSDLLDSDGAAEAGLDAADGDDALDLSLPQDPGVNASGDNDDPPAAAPSSADPLRAERRRSNQLEKELRKARAQLSRFSEINPDEYARLQDAER